ncbi:MAG: hypothetical protein IPP90_10380 [Gemmatimonadaceae bacterium]|nr:hypothetical protein [Gemmatimonadaceae bacterium]
MQIGRPSRSTWTRLAITGAVFGITSSLCSTPLLAQGTAVKRPPGAPDISKLPKSPKVPETFEGLFAERDARAEAALGYLRCLQGTVSALRSGALGQVPREWSITCVEQGREWRGVFGKLTDGGIDVRLQYAFRGAGGVLTTDRIDTARVNGTARALLRGLSAPFPGAGTYEFTPVPLPQPTFLEVWFLPLPGSPARIVVGGDSLIQMTSDGGRELGHSRSTPPMRIVTGPVSGATWNLESIEERIPAVSELMVARMALDVVPEVRVRSRQYESVLTRSGRWTHQRR